MHPPPPLSAASDHAPPTSEVLAELLRRGVESMFAQALEAEADDHVRGHADLRSPEGRRMVVRNGYLPHRDVQCGVGVLRVRQPRVHDHRLNPDGSRMRFASRILPPYARRTDAIHRSDPDRFFGGLAQGDLTEALVQVLGGDRSKLPESVVADLRATWAEDRRQRRTRTFGAPAGPDRAPTRFWATEIPVDALPSAGTSEPTRTSPRCVLVLAGQLDEAPPELVEVILGSPGDDQDWLDLLLDLRRRGLEVRPECVTEDAVPSFWQALRRLSLRGRVEQMAKGG